MAKWRKTTNHTLYVLSCLDEKTTLKMASQLPIAGESVSESSDPLIFKKGRYPFDK